MQKDFYIRPLETEEDRGWAIRFIREHWGSETMISRGIMHQLGTYPGFVALHQGQRVALLTYDIRDNACEVTSLDSTLPGLGIGTALLEAATQTAKQLSCTRLWLITSNDNIDALRFYQKRGFCLVAIHRDAITEARKLKPTIPLIGEHGIPIRDEVELELPLGIS